MKNPQLKEIKELRARLAVLANENFDLRSKIAAIISATNAVPHGAKSEMDFTHGDPNRMTYLAGYRLGKIETIAGR